MPTSGVSHERYRMRTLRCDPQPAFTSISAWTHPAQVTNSSGTLVSNDARNHRRPGAVNIAQQCRRIYQLLPERCLDLSMVTGVTTPLP